MSYVWCLMSNVNSPMSCWSWRSWQFLVYYILRTPPNLDLDWNYNQINKTIQLWTIIWGPYLTWTWTDTVIKQATTTTTTPPPPTLSFSKVETQNSKSLNFKGKEYLMFYIHCLMFNIQCPMSKVQSPKSKLQCSIYLTISLLPSEPFN